MGCDWWTQSRALILLANMGASPSAGHELLEEGDGVVYTENAVGKCYGHTIYIMFSAARVIYSRYGPGDMLKGTVHAPYFVI